MEKDFVRDKSRQAKRLKKAATAAEAALRSTVDSWTVAKAWKRLREEVLTRATEVKAAKAGEDRAGITPGSN